MAEEEINARWARVEAQMVLIPPNSDDEDEDEFPRLGYAHCCYRDAEQLHGAARRIYEVAADIAGLSLQELVKAVHALEVMMEGWEREERRKRLEQGNEGVKTPKRGRGSQVTDISSGNEACKQEEHDGQSSGRVVNHPVGERMIDLY